MGIRVSMVSEGEYEEYGDDGEYGDEGMVSEGEYGE